MRKLLLTAGVLAMSVATASVAKPGDNRGGGNQRAERSQGGGGGGGGQRANRGQGGGGEARQSGNNRPERAQRVERRQEQRVERRDDRREDRVERRAERREDRRENRVENRAERRVERVADRRERRAERRAVEIRDVGQVERLRWQRGNGLVDGCPPGLARRNNGCMPPGLARQQTRAWYDNWWNLPENSGTYRYSDGYLYQLAPNGAVAGFVPLLGGALWPGQVWPAQYEAASVPDYFLDYYGSQQPYDYQLADGVIYGLDPQTQAIQQVLALVTGDDWSIGQRMPDGYGVYNVPYQYRDQYSDTADSLYRYDDGYVYQVDPTTQLIQAAIQLIT